MNKITFLHCGDLHLGCMPNHLEERYEDFFKSFDMLIQDAIENSCRYILISGDLFHLKVINSRTLLKVLELLEKAKKSNIKVLVIEGNHDKAFYVDEKSWLEFLHSRYYITLLKHKIINGKFVLDESSIYEDEDIRVIGIGYLGSATSLYIKDICKKIQKSKKYTILMMHAAINRLCGEDMGDVSIDKMEPLQEIVDYVALGHIHTKYEYNNVFYNPGSLENIRLKDGKKSNKKGYFIVSVEEKKHTVVFKESVKRKVSNISINLKDKTDLEEVIRYLKNYKYDLNEGEILELTLYGNVPFNPYLINIEELRKTIKEKYRLLYVEISNLINIINTEKDMSNFVDIKAIEEETIKDYISVNYPTLKENNELINEVLDLKNRLIENEDYDEIISKMLTKGGSL